MGAAKGANHVKIYRFGSEKGKAIGAHGGRNLTITRMGRKRSRG